MEPSMHTPVRPLYRIIKIIWYVFYIVQVLLLLRLLLRLIGASTGAPFTQFIYQTTQSLMNPFLSMVRPWPFPPGVLDWNILIAMFVYWIIAWIIVELLLMMTPISSYEASQRLREQQHRQ